MQRRPAPAPAARRPAAPPPAAAAPVAGRGHAAAAKMMADNNLPPARCAVPARRPRDQGDVLARGRGRRRRARWPRPVAAPARPSCCPPAPRRSAEPGRPPRAARADEPPARPRAERLLQSQATNAILTTFNEVNMAPVMEMRKKFQEKFEKEHGVKLAS